MTSETWYKKWFSSPYYDILYKHRDYEEAKVLVENLHRRLAMEPQEKVLDVGCGHGRHAVHLHKMGMNVTGLDLSERKIEQAKQWERETLRFCIHDMRKPFAKKEYHYVFNFFTSFSYSDDPHDDILALKAMSDALLSQGKLVIDYLNPENIQNMLIENEEVVLDGVQFLLHRYVENNCIVKEIEVRDQSTTHHFVEKVRLLTEDDFVSNLKKVQLKHLCTFGNYYLRNYEKTLSERMILLAQKS